MHPQGAHDLSFGGGDGIDRRLRCRDDLLEKRVVHRLRIAETRIVLQQTQTVAGHHESAVEDAFVFFSRFLS